MNISDCNLYLFYRLMNQEKLNKLNRNEKHVIITGNFGTFYAIVYFRQ